MNTIDITLEKKEDLLEKYDNTRVSKQLLNYIVDTAILLQSSKYKILIESDLKEDFEKLIREGLKKELELSLYEKYSTNLKQICLLFLGAMFIGMSIYLKNYEMWHELILIVGWVPIWEAINIELFSDSKSRKRRKVIKKLLGSEIKIKKERNN